MRQLTRATKFFRYWERNGDMRKGREVGGMRTASPEQNASIDDYVDVDSDADADWEWGGPRSTPCPDLMVVE
jgi:hypothetical protein